MIIQDHVMKVDSGNDSEFSLDPEEKETEEKLLYDAAFNGQLEEVKRLSILYSDDEDVLNWALEMGCDGGQADVVKWLVEHTCVDVDYSKLETACHHERVDILKYLLNTSQIDVNLPSDGHTLLTSACYYNQTSVAMYLLSEVNNLNINFVAYYGNTALHYAVWCSKGDGFTELHWACAQGNDTEVRRLMRDYDHLMDAQNKVGDTPLHLACNYGHGDYVEILMTSGADETIVNEYGRTAAQRAEFKRHFELMELLNRDSLYEMIFRRNILDEGDNYREISVSDENTGG